MVHVFSYTFESVMSLLCVPVICLLLYSKLSIVLSDLAACGSLPHKCFALPMRNYYHFEQS